MSEVLILLHWFLRVSAGGTLSYRLSGDRGGDVSLAAFESVPADVWFDRWQIREAA